MELGIRTVKQTAGAVAGHLILAMALLLLAADFTPLRAEETGRIQGTIINKETGEPLIGAVVTIEGTKLGAQADLDGKFIILKVPTGTYDIIAQSVGFQKVQVNNIEVLPDASTKLDFSLTSEAVEGERIVVEAEAYQNTEATMLRDRQLSNKVSDAISAESMSRSGASDAASAMSKVTGATVQGGRFALVRGLAGRYTNTSLNGSQLPSTDPDKPAVQMDMIPTNLLDNIVVNKTFTPDLPGNFTGGSINLNTKDLPEKMSLTFSSSASYNSVFTGESVLTHPGPSQEWLGFAGDFYDMPGEIADNDGSLPIPSQVRTDSVGAATLDRMSRLFNTDFSPEERKAPLDQSYALSFGNLYSLWGRPLGVLASLSYSRKTSHYSHGERNTWWGNLDVSQNPEGKLDPFTLFDDTRSSDEVLWGGLISTSLRLSESSKLKFNYSRNQSGEKSARYLEGFHRFDDGLYRTRALEYTERSMTAYQFSGDHMMRFLGNTRVDWHVSMAENQQDEPDLRFFTDSCVDLDLDGDGVPDTTVCGIFQSRYPEPTHYFRYLTESNDEFGADFTIPLMQAANGSAKLKFGTLLTEKSRNQDNWAYLLKNNSTGTVKYPNDPDRYLVDENIGIIGTRTLSDGTVQYIFGITPLEQSRAADIYSGEQNVTAGYAMLEIPLIEKLDVIGGARYEHTDQWVTASDSTRGEINVGDWLPSANLVYHLRSNMNLRAAYSMTLARPSMREMAPFYSFEFINDVNYYGNPDLKRTLVRNYDLRWEWFTRPGEVIAISGFYKYFKDPIEKADLSSNGDVSFTNVPNAKVIGIEFEVRRRLDHTGIWLLQNLTLGGNLTLVKSEVDIAAAELAVYRAFDPDYPDTRDFQGQSPYVVNCDLTYSDYEAGTEISLLYNRFGDRLIETVYSKPDVYERAQDMLNLTASQQLWGPVTIRGSVKNILGAEYRETQKFLENEYTRYHYTLGTSWSLGLRYSI